jgi:hypothetical protein
MFKKYFVLEVLKGVGLTISSLFLSGHDSIRYKVHRLQLSLLSAFW